MGAGRRLTMRHESRGIKQGTTHGTSCAVPLQLSAGRRLVAKREGREREKAGLSNPVRPAD